MGNTASSAEPKVYFDRGLWPSIAMTHLLEHPVENLFIGEKEKEKEEEEVAQIENIKESEVEEMLSDFEVVARQKNKDGVVLVEFHQSESWNEIFYSVGQLFVGDSAIVQNAHMMVKASKGNLEENESIGVLLGASCKFGAGIQPCVGVSSSGHVVEVHSADLTNTLLYTVGRLNRADPQTLSKRDRGGIVWGETTSYDVGSWPCIALNNGGLAIAAHTLELNNRLYYRVGSIFPSSLKIVWRMSVNYAYGSHPSLAINDENIVVEVHQTKDEQTSCYRIGKVLPSGELTWLSKSTKYCRGIIPRVALHPSLPLVYEVHRKQYFYSREEQERVDEGVEIEPPPMEIYNQRGKIKETSDGASIQWEKVVEHQKGHAASIAACAVIASDVILQEEVVVTIHQKFDTLVLSSPESDVGVSLVQEVQI